MGAEDAFLIRDNCVRIKNTMGWKLEILGCDLKQITFSLWMSAGPSRKRLVWARTLHCNLTALTVYGSLKWAFLLPEEDHEVHGTVS